MKNLTITMVMTLVLLSSAAVFARGYHGTGSESKDYTGRGYAGRHEGKAYAYGHEDKDVEDTEESHAFGRESRY